MRAAISSLVVLTLAACAGTPSAGPVDPPKPVKLMPAAAEAETGSRTARRTDLDVRTETGERQPLVVSKGETAPLRIPPGVRVFLAGDEAGKEGFEVDNFVLFEVVEDGKVGHRFVVGFHEGVTADGQEIENAGKNGLKFEAREVDVTSHLPEGRPFVLRGTALDFGNVGKVTDLWLVFEAGGAAGAESWQD